MKNPVSGYEASKVMVRMQGYEAKLWLECKVMKQSYG